MATTFSSRMSVSGSSMGVGALSGGGSIRAGSSAMSLSGGSARTSILRAGSVYGGAGGAGVRISGSSRMLSMGGGGGAGIGLGMGGGFGFASAGGLGGGFSFGAMDGGVIGNEKFTMQNLNDRLASYLLKVRTLEKANAELELKIKQFLDAKATPEFHDYRSFMAIIGDLQGKIQLLMATQGSSRLTIDNANLALDDFKLKYETEASLRQSVEADVAGLKAVLGDLTFSKKDLSSRFTSLQEELAMLKKTHEEDLLSLRTQVGHKVNVELDAAPQEDITAVLAGVREHYEAVAAKNRKELEAWFQAKTEGLKREVAISSGGLEISSSETTTMKSTVQALQIELMSISSLKASLETTLVETQTRYAAMLAGYQSQVSSLEVQLAQLRSDLETQSSEYSLLLDIKTRLEMEIAEYKRLLDGQFASSSSSSSTRTKYVTVVEEVVDGKVVSSSSSSSGFRGRLA